LSISAVWKIIRPKLEALIEEEKERRLKLARDQRLTVRQAEFKPLWESLVADIRSTLNRNLIPPFSDACQLATVAEMLTEDEACTSVTEERILTRKDAIMINISEYQTKIKRELLKSSVSQPLFGTNSQPAVAVGEGEEVDLSILDRAATLFRCGSWYCKTLLPYPDIFEHDHIKELTTITPSKLGRMRPETTVKLMANLLLKTLGLPEDAPATALFDPNMRLKCLCGHPNYRKPTDFGTMVGDHARFAMEL
jgi:hypothetical protein